MNGKLRINQSEKSESTVISLFAGCGGSSLGYKTAGFRELLAVDFDSNAVETFKFNFPEVPIWERDIKEVSGEEILAFTGLKAGELDVLDGSPPCQGFSMCGDRKVSDPRNDLFIYFAKLVNELRPKVFVMENVSGQVKGVMKGRFKEIMSTLTGISYDVKVRLMNAKYYGVPQSRERVIYIGVRSDLRKTPSFPTPNNHLIPVRKVIFGILNDDLSHTDLGFGRVRMYAKKMRPGDSASKYNAKGGFYNYLRAPLDRPSHTVTKTRCLLHPVEDRFMSIMELKRLSTFPDDFKFVGSYTQQWARIGNAVMPKMMEAIASHIRDNILVG